jgi:cytidyltransferase-like protein
MNPVIVSGVFDNIRSGHVRFLEEASRLGPVTVLLRDDPSAAALLGRAPKFAWEERRYFLGALRWVERVEPLHADCPPDALPDLVPKGALWVMLDAKGDLATPAERSSPDKLRFCRLRGIEPLDVDAGDFSGFRRDRAASDFDPRPGKPRVVATGSFDWLHTGHIRFFEEASAYGELTVVVGHDANIRLLKGEGHPLVPEEERRYMVASVRSVARALISTGSGWLDAEPEIGLLRPDRYVVNADGDKPEKRRFCEERGIEYIVLAREPRPGLPRRSSTDLRGF